MVMTVHPQFVLRARSNCILEICLITEVTRVLKNNAQKQMIGWFKFIGRQMKRYQSLER
jgi:hypothetical protein